MSNKCIRQILLQSFETKYYKKLLRYVESNLHIVMSYKLASFIHYAINANVTLWAEWKQVRKPTKWTTRKEQRTLTILYRSRTPHALADSLNVSLTLCFGCRLRHPLGSLRALPCCLLNTSNGATNICKSPIKSMWEYEFINGKT